MTTTDISELPTQADDSQYSLTKILAIWAIVAIPMPLMAFVLAPTLAPKLNMNPLILIWLLMIAGMIWQFIVSVWLLYRELDKFTWAAICKRIWLQKPRDPKTGKASYKLFWWLIPAFAFYALIEMTPVSDTIGRVILIPLPFLSDLPDLDLSDLAAPEFVGAWWLMGVAVVSCLFNYFLGEELLFRGVLLHRPVQMLGFIIGGLALSLPSRHFRSIWFAIILHGFEGIFVLVGVFAVVSGLAF